MSKTKLPVAEPSGIDASEEFESLMLEMQDLVGVAWLRRVRTDYSPQELLRAIKSSREKIRTAISEKETYKITASYLQAALSLVEWNLYTEGALDKKSHKLLHSCITITVENAEETEDQRRLNVFKLWIWRLMLHKDFIEDTPVNASRVRSILEMQKKIHQKFFDQKLYAVWIAYTEAKRSDDVELQTYALSIMKDYSSVLSLQMGGIDSSLEKSNLRFAAFVRSLEIDSGSKDLFAMMVVVTKVLILARHSPELSSELLEDTISKVRNIILTYLKDNTELLELVDDMFMMIRSAIEHKLELITFNPEAKQEGPKTQKRANRYYLKKKQTALVKDSFAEDYKKYAEQRSQDKKQQDEGFVAKGVSAALISKRSRDKTPDGLDSFNLGSSHKAGLSSRVHGLELKISERHMKKLDLNLDLEKYKVIRPKSQNESVKNQIHRSSSAFRLQTTRPTSGNPVTTSTSGLAGQISLKRIKSHRGIKEDAAAHYVFIESTRDSNKTQLTIKNHRQMKDLVKNSLKEANRIIAKGPISVTEDVIIDPDFKSSTQRREEDWQALKYKLIRMRWMRNPNKQTNEETSELLPREVIKYPPQFMLLERPASAAVKVKPKSRPPIGFAKGGRNSYFEEEHTIQSAKVEQTPQRVEESRDSAPRQLHKQADEMRSSMRSHKPLVTLAEQAEVPVVTKAASPPPTSKTKSLSSRVKKVLTLNKFTSMLGKDKSKFNPETKAADKEMMDSKHSVRDKDESRHGDMLGDVSSIQKIKGDHHSKLHNLLPRPIESSESEGDGENANHEGLSFVKSKHFSVNRSEMQRGDKTFRGLANHMGDDSPERKWTNKRILRLETKQEEESDEDDDSPDEEQIRIEQSQRFVSQNSLNRKQLNGRKPVNGIVREIDHNPVFKNFMRSFLNGLEIILVSNRSFAMRRFKQVFVWGSKGLRRLNTMEAAPNFALQVEVYDPDDPQQERDPDKQKAGGLHVPRQRNSKAGDLLVPSGIGQNRA